MNCINLKQKLDKTLYCKYKKCTIKISECNGCPYKEYKKQQCSLNSNKMQNKEKMHNKSRKTVQKSLKNYTKLHSSVESLQKSRKKSTLKQRTNKLNKLEKNRFSLFSDNDSQCMLCGSTYQLTWNEVFRGKNRKLSMQYGLCQRLCLDCHRKYQDDPVFNDKWHKKGQEAFNKEYPNLDFIKIFGRNYLNK